jgi:choline dehydrogenase-like flavoprotein
VLDCALAPTSAGCTSWVELPTEPLIRSISDVDGQRLAADVCVIGSGAAGLTLATELCESSLKMIVLAGGPEHIAAHAQALYRVDMAGLRMGGAERLRFRAFGGSTRRWAGQLLPFVDEDFQAREWVPHSGWPISLADLAPYYTRASEALRVPPFPQGGRAQWPQDMPAADAFDQADFERYCSVFMANPDMAHAHRRALAASKTVDVLLDASATELLADSSGVIERARVRGAEHEEMAVEANTFVVCAGGLESTRILLASGLGVDRDMVGRFFQEHGGISVPFSSHDPKRLSGLLGLRSRGGLNYQPYLRASPALQRASRLPGASATITFEQPAELIAGKELFRAVRDRSRRAGAPQNLRVAARRPGPLIRAAARHFFMHKSAQESSATPRLVLGTEAIPNPQSRLSLADERDELGVRRLVVDWRLTELDMSALRTWLEVLASGLERAGLATVNLDRAPPLDDPMHLSGVLVDAGHHMGSTRMALRAEEGVVDPDCRVFGADNLFVISSSVFPTSGTSNPTFTIVALALRLADRLRTGAGA